MEQPKPSVPLALTPVRTPEEMKKLQEEATRRLLGIDPRQIEEVLRTVGPTSAPYIFDEAEFERIRILYITPPSKGTEEEKNAYRKAHKLASDWFSIMIVDPYRSIRVVRDKSKPSDPIRNPENVVAEFFSRLREFPLVVDENGDIGRTMQSLVHSATRGDPPGVLDRKEEHLLTLLDQQQKREGNLSQIIEEANTTSGIVVRQLGRLGRRVNLPTGKNAPAFLRESGATSSERNPAGSGFGALDDLED